MTQPQEAAAEEAMAETVSIDEALVEEALAETVSIDEVSADPGEAEAVSTRDVVTALDLTDPAALRSALEALLFVADAPVQLGQLAAAVQRPAAEVAQALAEITADLDSRDAGWQLRPAATGFRLYTRDRYAPVVEAFLLDGQRAKLSQAALETLAVVAYRQPVTRARISAIRGVNVDGVVRTLLARELITEVGSDPETGGGLYRTTSTFLEKMGIASVDELPSLAPLLPELDTLDLDEL
ncbi:MAG: segregation and condensation protein [Pseudonocardiales bacterium]|jgi:segregation and condensation protein B|nr:segregation and condensation protein [Pseudonocardiales bacterium]